MTPRPFTHALTRLRATILFAIVAILLLVVAAPALAHVELAASTPTDGAQLDTAPASIRLEFSTASTPAGEGLLLYDQDGVVLATDITIESETVAVITPTTPLTPGQYLVAWTMRAGDAHPKTGSVTFSVIAPVSLVAPGAASGAPETPIAAVEDPPAVFESITQQPSTAVADWVGRLARMMGFVAVLLGLGAFVFAALVFEGSQREARMVGFWGRRAGAAILLAVPLEIASQAMLLGGGSVGASFNPSYIVESLQGPFGLAMLLRSVGGASLFLGTRLVTSWGPTQAWQPSAPTGGGTAVATAPAPVAERFHVSASPIAIAGAVAVALSFLFDGHTAVTAPSWLVRFASVVHVTAAATWVGGVAMMAALFGDRRKRGLPADAAWVVIPFSTVAGFAVVLVGLAGSVLALTTVDSFGEFFSTPWGRALIAKLTLVGVAGAMGAYNHQVVVPLLKLDPNHTGATTSVGRTIQIEIGVLLGVAAMTAILVGLASS